MNMFSILIVALICILCFMVIFFIVWGNPFSEKNATKNTFSRMISSQHGFDKSENDDINQANKIAKEANVEINSSSRLTLVKRLKYAQLSMPPSMFYFLEAIISIVVASGISIKFDWPIVLLSLSIGPIIMNWYVNSHLEQRFNDFDMDYSPFLMSLVSMLKTGMGIINAMSTAAAGLESDSLVREEVELMIEKLRFGVTEDKAIGSFADTVYHPEIELFVQAVSLSKNLGGSLTDTLERLSEQVRKRQYFRDSAKAAVGMQKGSLVVLLLILVGIEIFIFIRSPEMVIGAINNDIGWMIWEGAIGVIGIALYWISQVTKIRI